MALGDATDFQLSNRIATQSHAFIIPPFSKQDGEPITYNLEPYLPMVAQGNQTVPNVPHVALKLPSGSLVVRVTRPDGTVNTMGPSPFSVVHSRTPSTSAGHCVYCGGPHLSDVLQLSTGSGLFDYHFTDYGEYAIEMTGTVEDIYGNQYEGGGTYTVYVAEPLDLEPATLPMTPLQVGDTFNSGLTVLPGLPAHVEVKVSLLINSDRAQKVEYFVQGRANRFGTFTPGENATPIKMTGPGEFVVETTATHTDANGVLWMGSTRWGQVVETPGSPLIGRGRRGRDTTPFDEVKIWFDEPLPPSISSHTNFPYASGDIMWQTNNDSALIRITVQDTEGLVEKAIRAWYDLRDFSSSSPLSLEDRIRLNELPLTMVTANGLSPAITPDNIASYGYWYGASQRPGVRVREILRDDDPGFASTYWDFDEPYALQPGMGLEGDKLNDFKFLFGGAVFRDTTRELNRYGIYGALWVMLPDADPPLTLVTRVFPPFQGANGGPSAGPIMTLAGKEIDAFVVPLAVRPGTILESGDTFSFSAHLAPTLPAMVDVTVNGPNGFSQSIGGRANNIGYFYDPGEDFVVTTPGIYHVSVTATFDMPTSAGPMSRPYPTGTVLGAVDQGFDVYVVPQDGPMLSAPHPDWSVIQGVSRVPLLLETPKGVSSGTVYYTIGMPGFLLESGTAALADGYTVIEYDPVELNRTFPNIDTRASRTDRRNSGTLGLVDTVWVNALLEGDDGEFYARQFTLQGPDLYAQTVE